MPTTEAIYIANNPEVFCCPRCQGTLALEGDDLLCQGCRRAYEVTGDIPRMFTSNEWDDDRGDVTDRIKQFYEATPFPNYDDFDSAGSLIEKARQGVFARLLDEQLPIGARVLEAGCGTGQLTAFLSIHNRSVFGADLCINSLTMAKKFRDANRLRTAHFLQMNLFRPCFRPGAFDVVISNGVIHHTSDPYLAYQTLAKLVKPGGYLIIGLYHKYGRLATDIRRVVFNLTRDHLKFLDPRNLNTDLSDGKRRAWFMDQYKNPHESKHTIGEVLGWIRQNGLDFVKSIPKTRIATSFSASEPLFEREPAGGTIERTLVELGMAVRSSQIKEGGFFIVIAQAKA
ncbi:MAG TPA: methyltransferase domain-containing protein [Gemmatimonadaceae bacterium]|jgi:SAM-dependent methyltransferase|nr:methyltransferase domain-containing protein [Gemmatimonadaceae bacterium]